VDIFDFLGVAIDAGIETNGNAINNFSNNFERGPKQVLTEKFNDSLKVVSTRVTINSTGTNKIGAEDIAAENSAYTISSLRVQKQFFLKKHFSIFNFFFFYNFIPFGIKFKACSKVSSKILSSLLFLPDKFLFLNYSGFFVQDKKYTNIVPLLNVQLNLKFKRKKSLPLKNTNIFL
jgi:hypothetical protein